ncbi:Profilin family protein [Gossypium australe]|uniref:Profilin family protein n=1 Tax=Gossypium australe TaxID=47621 RepID=A0A5B6VJE5_9ROSI|nr:Profilin family protein [Gossypium australe]
MDWVFVQKSWEKWASSNIGSSGPPLKAALLINYDPLRPSRLLSTIAEQEGIKISPIELSQFVNFIKRNKLQKETFMIGNNQSDKWMTDMVTSIHENWFCARCLNTSKSAGEGAIVMQTSVFLLVALYDGSIGLASRAMASVDQLVWQLNRKNL